MHKRISRAFISVRERACVSYANIATIGGFCDVDLTIVKATSPDDSPLQDKYVLVLLKIFSISSSSYRAFTLSFIRRFRRTKSWRVAVKCLLLLHRLIRSLPDDSPLRAELSWARTSGLLSLYPCNFRDHSSSAYEDYTTFVRCYARLLDEILDYTHIETTGEKHLDTISMFSNLEEQVPSEGSSPQIVLDEWDSPRKPKDLGKLIELLPQLQSLIDRSIECSPKGKAARKYLVQSVMKLIIRDTFTFYSTFRNELVTVLDNLIQLPNHSRVTAFSIYKIAAIQAGHLSKFHDQSKLIGHFESHEYPFIDQIPLIQVQALENFLSGMCHLSNDLSYLSNRSTITMMDEQSVTSPRDEDSGNEVVQAATESNQVVKYVEMEPLIKWDDEVTNQGWEDILEASISTNAGLKWSDGNFIGRTNGWEIQQYNNVPYGFQTQNPFYSQPQNTYWNYHSCPNTPMRSLIDL